MKKCVLFLSLSILFLFTAPIAKAQYRNAVGLRLWYYPGITYKHHISDPGALEFIFDLRWGGLIITGLYEHHFPLGPENLNVYVGGGVHLGFYDYYSRWGYRWGPYDGGVFMGLDGIVGLEYTLPTVPLNFSLDYKPMFSFIGYRGFWGDGGALSVRYTF